MRQHWDAYELVKNGLDPIKIEQQAKEEREKALTVTKLVGEYLKKHAVHKKDSGKSDKRLLEKEIVPHWGNRKAEDIKKRDVILLLESIFDRGTPAMCNQVLKITRKMFNFAIERDILQSTPFLGVKALAPNVKRERVLTKAEIKTLWGNLDGAEMSNEIKRCLKLVLLTAQRPGEVVGMHTSEIKGEWWTIPAARSKNGITHRVPLTSLALEIINEAIADAKVTRELPAEEEYSGYVFPCPHRAKYKPIERHALSRAVDRNLVVQITDQHGKLTTENKLGVIKFTPHDLRRTAATFMAELGQMDEVIGAVLNHKKVGIIATYNLYRYDKQKRVALEVWQAKLRNIISS